MAQARSQGLNQQQIDNLLKQKGYSDSQIAVIRRRLQNMDQGPNTNLYQTPKTDRQRTLALQDKLLNILDEGYIEQQKQAFGQRIFGYSLFNQPDLSFEPSTNLPTPAGYVLGPQDEVVIDIWGASEANYRLNVNPEGYVLVRNIGPIQVNGLTIEAARSKIISRLSEIYSGLRGSNPNTFAQVSLGNVRSINVSIIGEVKMPGTYTLSSLSSVFNALYVAGGPSTEGTFREIELIRGEEVMALIDLYDFLTAGVQENVKLQDQDIVRVGPYLNRVIVSGEVKREEEIYEAIEGETVKDIIEYAGGFTDKAFTATIKVSRNTDKARKIIDVPQSMLNDFEVKPGDQIEVEPILNRYENRVQIEGAVFRPGSFELEEGLTLSKLVEKAEGLRGDAFLERVSVYRVNEDLTTTVIPVNYRELTKDKSKELILQREDLVKISSIYDLKEEYYVQISGEVRQPGIYPYINDMDVEDLVVLAGGLLESASESHLEIARRYKNDQQEAEGKISEILTMQIDENLALQSEDKGVKVRPFDVIYVRKAPGYELPKTIKLEGEVVYPGFYGIERKTERISDVIRRAGGITEDAYPQGATLIRRNEFYLEKTVSEQRTENVSELRRKTNLSLESEKLRRDRLENIRYGKIEEEVDEAIKVRQQNIAELDEQLEGVEIEEPKTQETIGINLNAILDNPGSKFDLIVQDGDILSIPKELQTVRLRGELLYPITVRYDDRKNFIDYVSNAGGFTTEAKKTKAYVVYANGSVDRTRRFLFFKDYPKVEPGAEIIIPTRPEREGLNAQQIIGLGSSIGSLALTAITVITLINNNNGN
jgi:protein involved in polysaccharide export with SLBB domain